MEIYIFLSSLIAGPLSLAIAWAFLRRYLFKDSAPGRNPKSPQSQQFFVQVLLVGFVLGLMSSVFIDVQPLLWIKWAALPITALAVLLEAGVLVLMCILVYLGLETWGVAFYNWCMSRGGSAKSTKPGGTGDSHHGEF